MAVLCRIPTWVSLLCRCCREPRTLYWVQALVVPGIHLRLTSMLKQIFFSWRTTWIWEARWYFLLLETPDHSLHETLHIPLGSRMHIHSMPISHNTALFIMTRSPSLVWKVSGLMPTWVFCGGLWPPHLLSVFWERLQFLSDQMRLTFVKQNRVHLTCLRHEHHLVLRSFENRLHSEIDSACKWCGNGPDLVSHIFQECPQLAGERVKFGASYLRDKPEITLKFYTVIGLIPVLDQRVSGISHGVEQAEFALGQQHGPLQQFNRLLKGLSNISYNKIKTGIKKVN